MHPYLSTPSNPSCARCRPNHQVVVDGAHAGRHLGEDMDCLLFGLQLDDAPQVDGAVLDGDADQGRPGPALVLKLAMTLSRIAESSGRVWRALSFKLANACSRLARLTMPTIFPFLTIGTRLIRFFSSSAATSATEVSGEAVMTSRVMTSATLRECDLTYSAARSFIGCQGIEPPGLSVGGFRFGAIDQIAFTHDPENLAIGADHRYGTDPVAQQQIGDLLNARIGTDRDDVRNHYVGGLHGSSLLLRPCCNRALCRSLLRCRPPYRRGAAGQPNRLKVDECQVRPDEAFCRLQNNTRSTGPDQVQGERCR